MSFSARVGSRAKPQFVPQGLLFCGYTGHLARMAKDIPDLTHLAQDGTEIAVRVTPKASRSRITVEDGAVRVYVTTPPEDGKANAAVQKLLAKSVGVAKSRLTLIRGQTARDKVFRVE